jgi:hypothetical protein
MANVPASTQKLSFDWLIAHCPLWVDLECSFAAEQPWQRRRNLQGKIQKFLASATDDSVEKERDPRLNEVELYLPEIRQTSTDRGGTWPITSTSDRA